MHEPFFYSIIHPIHCDNTECEGQFSFPWNGPLHCDHSTVVLQCFVLYTKEDLIMFLEKDHHPPLLCNITKVDMDVKYGNDTTQIFCISTKAPKKVS